MTLAWHDVVGLVGVAFVLVAYGLLQTARMRSDSLHYSLLNGIGAALVLFSLVFAFNLAAFVVEGFWLLISLYGLWRWKRARDAVPR